MNMSPMMQRLKTPPQVTGYNMSGNSVIYIRELFDV